jgi:pantothenate kinase
LALQEIEPFPWFLNKDIPLLINGLRVEMHIRAAEWTKRWRPFLSNIIELQRLAGRRMVVGIAGTPGSGKSVFAAQIAWMATKNVLPKINVAALPMDGFHLPDAVLAERFLQLEDGRHIRMNQCKGAPETFDAAMLREHLTRLKQIPTTMTWPGYDRVLHKPVSHALHVHESVNLVLVEGSYLFMDREPYAGLAEMFDLRIYIEAPPASVVTNLMNRHMEGGKTVGQAKDWVKHVDLPNARLVEETKPKADVLIQRDRDGVISTVVWVRARSSSEPIPDDV